mgnify:CR=1 FL=1
MRPARALGAAALAGLGCLALLGAAAAPPKIEGAWAFRTAPYREGKCTLSGTMNIVRTNKPDVYTCTFVAFESCDDVRARAEETCIAKRTDSGVEITSTLKSVTPDLNYVPDDFALDQVTNARMEGLMLSAADAEVVFTRPNPAIS